jgi:hypothetical protein
MLLFILGISDLRSRFASSLKMMLKLGMRIRAFFRIKSLIEYSAAIGE